MGSKPTRDVDLARKVCAFMDGTPGLPGGLTIKDHPDGGYEVSGTYDFTSYLGSPLACESLDEFDDKVALMIDDYREHLWAVIQEDS